MVDRSASNDSNDDLSPRLRPVLSSLNVNLESELNRYRRNRLTKGASSDNVFADLDDATFDIDVDNIIVTSPTASMPSPPPLPPNRRLNGQSLNGQHLGNLAVIGSADQALAQPDSAKFSDLPRSMESEATGASSIVNATAIRADNAPGTPAPNGYLESSEKLIESLDDLPPMPEPVDINLKSKRKTVSLLAGAILGLFGLIAGLGVSYIVSSPTMTQKLADLFKGKNAAVVAEAEKEPFAPPGPDLSEREFVDLDLAKLSSLKMSPAPLDPATNPSNQSPPESSPTAAQLPPIGGQPASSGIQAAVVPVGVTYYATVPFTTEQDLTTARAVVEEAFVRSFSGGNRIQLAAFDNLAEAQRFVDDVKKRGVTAFVYGPTTE